MRQCSAKDLKYTKHCKSSCMKTNSMLEVIPRELLFLYTSLEYVVQFSATNYIKKDIEEFESTRKMIPSLRTQPYEERR